MLLNMAMPCMQPAYYEMPRCLGANLAVQEQARTAELRAAAQASHAQELQAALDAAACAGSVYAHRCFSGCSNHPPTAVSHAWLPRSNMRAATHHLSTSLPICRLEMQRTKDEREDGAAFLLACLEDARQERLSQQGRAELASLPPLRGTAAPASGLSAIAEQPQQVEDSRPSEGSTGQPNSSGRGSRDATQSVQLAELPPQQREAVLSRLLEQLVDWGAREGLLLPATSGSCPPGLNGPNAVAPAAAQGMRCKPVVAAVATGGSPGAAPSKAACLRSSSSSALSSGSKGVCSRSELLELVLSDVRPWGGGSLSSRTSAAGAASAGVSSSSPSTRRLGCEASDGSR